MLSCDERKHLHLPRCCTCHSGRKPATDTQRLQESTRSRNTHGEEQKSPFHVLAERITLDAERARTAASWPAGTAHLLPHPPFVQIHSARLKNFRRADFVCKRAIGAPTRSIRGAQIGMEKAGQPVKGCPAEFSKDTPGNSPNVPLCAKGDLNPHALYGH
ncbi:MAG: hypothetical protein QOF79_1531 [Actinomycetota bacterium]|nr:hypothetical protein [Actinomycetota bacterium]